MSRLKNKEILRNGAAVFAECFIMFLISILPFLISADGRFMLYGDNNLHTVPTLFHIYDVYHEGLPVWDWNYDLGIDFWSTICFGNLTSPYTLLMLPFPRESLLYVLTAINALKFGVMGLTAYIYCRQYTKKESSAHLCGLLYAFSGVQIINIVFHFSDFFSIFPLVMYSFDRLMSKRRSLFFAAMLSLSCFINFFLAFSMCIFILIYFIVKVLTKDIKLDKKLFFKLAFETTAGIGSSAVVLIPVYFLLSSGNRTSNTIFYHNLISYENDGVILKLIQSLFFIPDQCRNGTLFPDLDLSISSQSLYIPLFTVVGVAAIIRRDRKSWYTKLIAVLGVMMLVPVFNSIYQAFNANYYARWFYMPILIMIMMTGKYIDDFETTDISLELKASAVIVGFFTLLGICKIIQYFALADSSYETYDDHGESVSDNFLNELTLRHLTIIMVFGVLTIALMYCIKYRGDVRFLDFKYIKPITIIVCTASMLLPHIEVIWYSDGQSYLSRNYNDFEAADTYDDSCFYRVTTNPDDSNSCLLYWGYPQIGLMNNVCSGEEVSFYERTGQTRTKMPAAHSDEYALNSFLSSKYDLFFNELLAGGIEVEPEDIKYSRKYYRQKYVENRYIIYENECFIPMGFTYDYFLPLEELDTVHDDTAFEYDNEKLYDREKLLLKAIWLTDEQIEKYEDTILKELPDIKKNDTSDEAYKRDCEERRASAAYEFTPDKEGFTSKIKLGRENLVFYSIPYDESFTAYIDGEQAEFERVFDGLTAILVPEGDHTIRFTYKTKGLAEGKLVSIICAGALAVYAAACGIAAVGKKRRTE